MYNTCARICGLNSLSAIAKIVCDRSNLSHAPQLASGCCMKTQCISTKSGKIDTSKVPTLDENDLEEQYVRGHGPGGSNVNKRSNCCVLTHKPTGIVVKCHQSRLLDKNREIARKLMIQHLDLKYNGEDSIAAQKEAIARKKSIKSDQRRKKLAELKAAWKEREGIQ